MSDARAKAWETRRAKYGPKGHNGSYSRGGFMGALEEMREAMRPFFDERRRVREENSPAIMQRLAASGVIVDTIGGNCPVQAEGLIDGEPFYFRARGDSWELNVGPQQTWHGHGCWIYEEGYGEWPDAGWMHDHEALAFIEKAAALYRDRDRDPEGAETVKQGSVERSEIEPGPK